MSKVKSLVVVTVDNVFRNFLIDDERYELIDCVEDMHERFFKTNQLVVPSTVKNERIKAFLGTVMDSLSLGAVSLVRVQREWDNPNSVPEIVRDRARRAKAGMNPYDSEPDWEKTATEDAHTYLWCLFSSFRDSLREAHIETGGLFNRGRWHSKVKRPCLNSVPSDMELQS